MMRQRLYQRRQRGVTIIELALVLGVAGLIVGGIWAAASAASEARKVNETVDQMRQIVENTRTRYLTANQIPQQGFTDFTQTVAAANAFPAETWLTPGDPTGCAVATPCYFYHAFESDGTGSTCGGGTYCLGSNGNLLITLQGNANSGFVLLLRALPQAACVKIATSFLGVWDGIGITGMGFNNGDAGLPSTPFPTNPPTATQVQASCAAGNANSLYIAFRHAA